jgi:hypothetical protein
MDPDILSLLTGRLFIQNGCITKDATERLYRRVSLKLHPDKISTEDLKYITDNGKFLMECFGNVEDQSSLPFYILEHVKREHLSFIEKMEKVSGVKIYDCAICDQHINTNDYCRVSNVLRSGEYFYFHVQCVKKYGYMYIRNAYFFHNDASMLFGLQKYLEHKDFEKAWLFYIEAELDEMRYYNVFCNLFQLLKLPTDGHHNQPFLRRIAIKLHQQRMKLDVFIDILKQSEECSCMDFLFRIYFMLYLEREEQDPSKTMEIITKIRPKFRFAEKYFKGKCQFFDDILCRSNINDTELCRSEALTILGIRKYRNSCFGLIVKNQVRFIAKIAYQNRKREDDVRFKNLMLLYLTTFDNKELNDFFTYAFNFSIICQKWPKEAGDIYRKYQCFLNYETRRCATSVLPKI